MLALAEAISFHWIDAVGLAILLLFAFLGARRGLWWQIVRLLGAVAVMAVARAVGPRLAPSLAGMFDGLDPAVAEGLLWVGCVTGGFLLVAFIGRIGKAESDGAEFTTADRVGGALVGIATGMVVFAGVLISIALVAGSPFAQRHIAGTTSERMLASLADSVPGLLDVHAADSLQER